jgi:UDP-2,3-diacylglucosamine pyrophosphatase LpxH
LEKRKKYKTVVISDVHLGSNGSKAEDATTFLKQLSCEKLILNGDIIDGWQLKKYGTWRKKHTGFLRVVLRMMEKDNTKVIYIRGNHDDFLHKFQPIKPTA